MRSSLKLTQIACSTALTLSALALTSPAQAQDVGSYLIQKQATYDQTSAATPYLDPEQPYQLFSYVQATTGYSLLTSTTLTTPGNTTLTFSSNAAQGPNSAQLSFQEYFSSKNALDTAFGAGTCNLSVWTATPNHYYTQLVIGSDAYPSVLPQITSVTNASWQNGQLVVPDATLTNSLPVTLNWPGYSGGIYLSIGNNSTNIFNGNVSGTSYTIPGGTLKSGQYYRIQLQFTSPNVTNSNPNPIPNSGGGVYYQDQLQASIQAGSSTTPSSAQYVIQKRQVLSQTSNNAPTALNGTFGYGDPGPFDFSIQSASPGTVTGTNSTSFPLTYTDSDNSSTGGEYFYSSGPVANQTTLNTSYPSGSYTFPDSQSLSYTGGFPNTPQVLQVNGATPTWNGQGSLMLDPTVSNTITWTTFNTQSNPGFHESFDLESQNSGSVTLKQEGGFLNSTPAFNTYTIPANTLTTGSSYTAYIEFGLGSGTSVGSTIHFVGLSTETYFNVLAEPSAYNLLLQVNTPQGSTWVASPWFGTVNVANSTFIYSLYLGFAAPFGQDFTAVWFYDSTMNDYVWTSNNTFPYFYGYKNNKWYYIYTGSTPSSPSYASIYEFNGRGWIFLNQY